jgi:methionyl-tRNA formyltransferase
VGAVTPDFLFSFYYRRMLSEPLLRLARRGALNMHGSLLPRYRGRAPVNWAVINGERETGATLHYMTAKPDQGDIVDQQAVPILCEDTAQEVFRKVTWAAELVLFRCLAPLIEGTAACHPQNLRAGSYFGARKPEEGAVDWRRSARDIHNLVRGVAPPYPGAFTTLGGRRLRILRTSPEVRAARHPAPALYRDGDMLYADCVDGISLRLLEWDLDGAGASAEMLSALGNGPWVPS